MRIPVSTYRLQLNRDFPFKTALEIVDYLDRFGISDCYLSPLAEARPGSAHGYDVVDHRVINPELGSEEEFANFAAHLRERGMGIVADIVPNHMAVTHANEWWWDVLQNGPSSPYAEFFDIDWNPPKADLANKVLLPVLGDQYGRVLENQEIRVVQEEDGGFSARYGEHRFPIAPRSLSIILEPALRALTQKLGDSHPQVLELESILKAIEHLPPQTETDRDRARERGREAQVIQRRIARLCHDSESARGAITDFLEQLNGVCGDPSSFDRMEQLLARQAYRLSLWKVASDEINYRRFFDVSDLAAIRVEDRAVFNAVHKFIFQLVEQGSVSGLRVDHVDGLYDPEQYLRRLQRAAAVALSRNPAPPGASAPSAEPSFYTVVEKILSENETLHPGWPVAGNTGYDFLNPAGGLFVAAENRERFFDIYARFIGGRRDFRDVVYESKKLEIETAMAGELAMLARRLDRISEQHRWSRDFTLGSLAAALAEVVACFPVYRSYVRAARGVARDEDRQHIRTTISRAKRRNPAISESIFDFVASVLLLEHPEGLTEVQRHKRREFVMRFQQITSPVMAKGYEDTALYRFYPLASLNEVGGSPAIFGTSVEGFHRWNQKRLEEGPDAMSATSTHDTKRGEDVRARLNALSEIPERWESAIFRWYEMNQPLRSPVEAREVPDANEEYLLYQTLIGAWPVGRMTHDERRDTSPRGSSRTWARRSRRQKSTRVG